MKVILLEPALDELTKARDYYLKHASARIAASFLEQFNSTAALILAHPSLGKPISRRLRSISVNHFPYSVIYRITSESIIVQAVAHQRRRPAYWAKRR